MADLDIPSSLLDSFNTRQDQELRKLLNTTSDQTIADIKDNELLDLADLGDVDIASLEDRDVLLYDQNTLQFINVPYGLPVSVKEFGAVGDGVTDDTAAIQAALNTGKVVYLPGTNNFYNTTSALTPVTGGGLVGDGPRSIIKLTSVTTDSVLRGNGVDDFYIDNIVLDGQNSNKTSGTHCLRLDNCTGWRVDHLTCKDAQNWGVGVYNSTGNKFGNIRVENAETSSGFYLSSSDSNTLEYLYAEGCGGFGLQVFSSSDNKIGTVISIDNGLEGLGVNYFSNRNTVEFVYSRNSGDNGCSITGSHNQVGTVYVETPDFHGLCVYGSNNIVGTVFARNVGQAGAGYGSITFTPAFGGSSQNNIVGNALLVDDQGVPTTTNAIKANPDSHASWVTATLYGPGLFVKNSGRVYYTALGGTSGGTPPTHSSGTVSDGGVLWQYIADVVDSAGNVVTNAKLAMTVTTPVDGTTRGTFSFSPEQMYHDLKWSANRAIRRVASAWAAGQSVTFGTWRSNAGNIYLCRNAGGTTADAPVHTSGSVTGADGVQWIFVVTNSGIPLYSGDTSGAQVHSRLRVISTSDITASRSIWCGAGGPDAVVADSAGSIFLSTQGTVGAEGYMKASGTGNTGWLAFTLRRAGTTAARPTPAAGAVGVEYFDTTLTKPIWWTGAGWVDATGAAA